MGTWVRDLGLRFEGSGSYPCASVAWGYARTLQAFVPQTSHPNPNWCVAFNAHFGSPGG